MYAAWRHPWPRIVLGLLFLGLGAFGWTAIVASLSGGFTAYREVTSSFFVEVVLQTKILGGGLAKIVPQVTAIGASALLGLGLFLIPFAVGAWGCLTGRWPFPGAAPFLGAWALPALAFHSAYDWAPRFGVMLLAPAAILAAATLAPSLKRDGPGRAFALLALAVNVGLFVLPSQIGGITLPAAYPSGSRLLARNADLERRDTAVRALDPESTVVLAYDDTFHAVWFLPSYRTVGLFGAFKQAADTWLPSARHRVFSFEAGSTAIPVGEPLRLPDAVRRLVLYDADYARIWPVDTLPLTNLPYDVDRSLLVADVPRPGCLAFSLGHIEFVPAGEGSCPSTEPAR
jgi:hypothetical protein